MVGYSPLCGVAKVVLSTAPTLLSRIGSSLLLSPFLQVTAF